MLRGSPGGLLQMPDLQKQQKNEYNYNLNNLFKFNIKYTCERTATARGRDVVCNDGGNYCASAAREVPWHTKTKADSRLPASLSRPRALMLDPRKIGSLYTRIPSPLPVGTGGSVTGTEMTLFFLHPASRPGPTEE